MVRYAAEIVQLCKQLPNDLAGQYYGSQLLRASGRIALNYGEAQGSRSSKDYIHKTTICLKELKESRVIMKILRKVNYAGMEYFLSLLNEVEELIRIMATINKNRKPRDPYKK